MARHRARVQEALTIAEILPAWLDALTPDQPAFAGYTPVVEAASAGLTETPRGALGHWLSIANGKIAHY